MVFSLDRSHFKHAFHVFLFVTWILFFQAISGVFDFQSFHVDYSEPFAGFFRIDRSRNFNAFDRYGIWVSILLYFLRVISLMSLPLHCFNTLGLICFNAFKSKVYLKNPLPLQIPPFICFRVVTRGDYPELVKANIVKNIEICREAGLHPEHYIFEVVTDSPLHVPASSDGQSSTAREIVVPSNYRTKTGAKFKARALQYCLEDEVNRLRDNDWIVHLDEETLLSVNAVNGILNFCEDGSHQFGQGVIYYARHGIVNWITTLSDSLRVADDFGKLRFQLKFFHKPLLNWKGSFVVAKAGAERRVNFDHGPQGSIAEDCYFGMIAVRDGFSFDFIEGEMDEKSPFSIGDYIRQRKRWFTGIRLTVHSPEIPLRAKFGLIFSFYSWALMPLTALQIFLAIFIPLPRSLLLDIPSAFLSAVFPYFYMFGVFRSFSQRLKSSCPLWMVVYLMCALIVAPITLVLESAAIISGIAAWITNKHFEFYIVDKQRQGSIEPVPTLNNVISLKGKRHRANRMTAPHRVQPIDEDDKQQNVIPVENKADEESKQFATKNLKDYDVGFGEGRILPPPIAATASIHQPQRDPSLKVSVLGTDNSSDSSAYTVSSLSESTSPNSGSGYDDTNEEEINSGSSDSQDPSSSPFSSPSSISAPASPKQDHIQLSRSLSMSIDAIAIEGKRQPLLNGMVQKPVVNPVAVILPSSPSLNDGLIYQQKQQQIIRPFYDSISHY